MVRGIDRQGQENQGSVLQSSSSGGLNVMSSRLSIPLADSPDLNNVKVNQRGNLQVRNGTYTSTFETSSDGLSGTILVPVKLRGLDPLIVAKIGVDLVIFNLVETVANNNRTFLELGSEVVFESVWDERARYVRPDYEYTSELEPRTIFTTGVNPPVQLKLVQSTAFDSDTSVSDPDSDGNDELVIPFVNSNLGNAQTDSVILYNDGVEITEEIDTLNFTNDTLEVGITNTNRTGQFTLIFASWQWWAEAVGVFGKRMYGRSTRNNADPIDRFVPIPADLLLGIRPYEGTNVKPEYPLFPTPSTNYSNRNDYSLVDSPSTSSEYQFTTGGFQESGTATQIGLTDCMFGATNSSIEDVHFHRALRVPFNGARGIEAQNLEIQVNGVSFSQNTDSANSASNSYYLYDSNRSNYPGSPLSNNNTRGLFFDFTAKGNMGISQTAEVIAVNVEPKFIGSNATSTIDNYGRGTVVPAFGFWEFCDYQEGSFPRTVSTYQSRLVFGGTPKLPLRVAVSEVRDTFIIGANFRDYQTRLRSGQVPSEPFQFDITGEINDSIRAIEEFNNSLFIFTENSTYRLTSGESGLSPTSFFVQYQVGLGAVNVHSVQRVENTMFFLTDSGVFDVSATDNAAEYAAAERSLKVRDFFQNTQFDQSTAWMTYDPERAELYVALSSTDTLNPWSAETLLIYSTFRNAWTIYSLNSGSFYTIHGEVVQLDDNKRQAFIAHPTFETTDSEGSPKEIKILTMNQLRPVDLHEFTQLDNDQTAPFNIDTNIPERQLTFTLSKDKYYYRVNKSRASNTSDLAHVFNLTPHREINDIKVEIDYDQDGSFQDLTLNEDYVKLRDGIYLTKVVPDDNTDLRVTALSQPEDQDWPTQTFPIRVWVDNVLQVQGTDYKVLTYSNQLYRIEMQNDLSAGSVIEVGLVYPSWQFSPLFFRSDMSSVKRFLHYYGYFNNQPYHKTYGPDDVNTTSGQDSSTIVGSYVTSVGFNVAFLYNDTRTGFVSDTDLYGSFDLFWDENFFDIDTPASQFNDYARIVEPIIGAVYDFQVGLLRNRATYFEQVGYQVSLRTHGRTGSQSTNSSDIFSNSGGGF